MVSCSGGVLFLLPGPCRLVPAAAQQAVSHAAHGSEAPAGSQSNAGDEAWESGRLPKRRKTEADAALTPPAAVVDAAAPAADASQQQQQQEVQRVPPLSSLVSLLAEQGCFHPVVRALQLFSPSSPLLYLLLALQVS